MSIYTARYHGSRAYERVPAWQAQLVIDKDGEYFQYGTVAISSEALLKADVPLPPSEAFLSSLARRSVERFREALEADVIPTLTPTDAHEVRLNDIGTVRACAADAAAPLALDDVVWSFEAD